MFSQQEKQRLEQIDLENLVGFFNILYQIDKRNKENIADKKSLEENCVQNQSPKN